MQLNFWVNFVFADTVPILLRLIAYLAGCAPVPNVLALAANLMSKPLYIIKMYMTTDYLLHI